MAETALSDYDDRGDHINHDDLDHIAARNHDCPTHNDHIFHSTTGLYYHYNDGTPCHYDDPPARDDDSSGQHYDLAAEYVGPSLIDIFHQHVIDYLATEHDNDRASHASDG